MTILATAPAMVPAPRALAVPQRRPYVVIAFMHRKGGVGKTKSTMFTAQAIAEADPDVSEVEVVDGDPGTKGISNWCLTLRRDYPYYEIPWHVYQWHPKYGLMADQVAEQHRLHGARVFCLDTPAEYPEHTAAAAALADVIVVPCGTHQEEIEQLGDTYTDAMKARPGTPIRVLLTRVEREHQGAAAEARATLEGSGYQLMETEIPRNAGVYGRFGRPIEDVGRYARVVDELVALGVGL